MVIGFWAPTTLVGATVVLWEGDAAGVCVAFSPTVGVLLGRGEGVPVGAFCVQYRPANDVPEPNSFPLQYHPGGQDFPFAQMGGVGGGTDVGNNLVPAG